MNLITVLAVGLFVGALTGGVVFFAREEPNKAGTFAASLLRGLLVSRLSGYSLGNGGPWWLGAVFGMLYGLAVILVLYLAEVGFRITREAPIVFASAVLSGAVIGLADALLAFPSA